MSAPKKDRTVEDVIAAFIAGEIPTRDRRKDGVTTRTNYSGANARAKGKRSRVVAPRKGQKLGGSQS